MKHHHRSAATWKLLLLFLLLLGSSAAPLQRSQQNYLLGGGGGAISRSPGRSLLSLTPERSTKFVAVREGKLLLLDKDSGSVIYTVDLGGLLYYSYQSAQGKDGGFYLDADEDGVVCIVNNGNGIRQNLHQYVGEVVNMTPYALLFEDGTVTHGSKNTTTFLIDALTGKVIHRYPSSRGEEQGILKGIKRWAKPRGPMNHNTGTSPQLLVMRTDYHLTAYSPGSNDVLWSLTYSDITVISTCSDIESTASEAGSGVVLPLSCQSKIRVRHQTHNSILPSTHGRLLKEQNKDKILSDPTSNAMHTVRRSPKGLLVMLFDSSRVWALTFSFVVLLGFVIYCYAYVVKRQGISNSDSNTAPSKRKKNRQSGKNASAVGEKQKHASSQDEEALALSEGDNKTLFLDKLFNGAAVGRRIGKLLISNTEIAKGSNGTVVLEGVYEGRPVAVKRLVLAHHDVAFKEIQNLNASDRYHNIVRWYGVEYDRDFVYLSLERCICNLDDLVQIYSNSAQIPIAGEEYATVQNKVRLSTVKNILRNVNLWKENG